jgi:hypothetical protein
MHGPLLDDPLSDQPQLVCSVCGERDFHQPDLAPQWGDPYVCHLSVVCDTCGSKNHLRVQWRLGRVTLTQRSTQCLPITTT